MGDNTNLTLLTSIYILQLGAIFITCIESALMISPLNFSAISIASFDFPAPVAPKITIKGRRRTSLMGAAILTQIQYRTLAPSSEFLSDEYSWKKTARKVGHVSGLQHPYFSIYLDF